MVHKVRDRDPETPKGNTKTKTQRRRRGPHTACAGTEDLADAQDLPEAPRHLVRGIRSHHHRQTRFPA